MRAYAGSLILIMSFVLSASAYGQTAVIAGKDCLDTAAVAPSDCGSPSRTDPASLTGDTLHSLGEPPTNDRQSSSFRDGNTGLDPAHPMSDTALSSGDSEPCATQVICPPPSASVNKLDSDLPSPTPLKTKTHRDLYSRPSTANNSFKSDQTKDERGRTVMGH